MANFTFNISDATDFSVSRVSLIETDCASQYEYNVISSNGDSMTVELTGEFINGYILSNGSTLVLSSGNPVTFTFSTDLYIYFGINNSGNPGIFNSVQLEVLNNTNSQSYLDTDTRQNDSISCDDQGKDGVTTFDELTDTPISKIGNAGKYVVVNESQDALVYADAVSNEAIYPVENDYNNIAELLADQANQTQGYFQFVEDATSDPNVISGEAYYEYEGGSTGTLADYRLLSDSEIETITSSNSYLTFKVQYIQDNSGPLTFTSGGRISFEYNSSNNLITGVLFNKKFSRTVQEYIDSFEDGDLYIRMYNTNTKLYEITLITGWEKRGSGDDWTLAKVEEYLSINDFSTNDKVKLHIDINSGSGAGSTSLESQINQPGHGFLIGDAIYLAGPGNYQKGLGSNGDSSGVIGVVKEVIDADNFIYQYGGIMSEGSWNSGVDYFLSVANSGEVIVEPTYSVGDYRVYIGTGVDEGLLINIDIGQQITQSGLGEDQNLEQVTSIGNTTTKNIIIDASGNNSRIFNEELSVIKSIENTGSTAGFFSDVKLEQSENVTSNRYAIVGRAEIDSSFDFGTVYGSYNYVTKTNESSGNGNILYGNLSEARNKGTGDLEFIIGVSAEAKSQGAGVGNSTYIRGINTKAEISSSDKSVEYFQGAHIAVNLAAGTVTGEVNINYLDFDYTSGTVSGDLSYITAKDSSIDFSFVQGDARFIDSQVPLPSRFGGILNVNVGVEQIENATEKVVINKEYGDKYYLGGSTSSLTEEVNQVGHGFSVSECLYFDGTNYIKGNADSLTTSGVIGFVKTVTDADNFVLQFGGIMTEGTWVSGTDYFLSNVTDGLVSDEPTYLLGEVRVYVGQGVENGLLINIDIGQEITEQGGGGSGGGIQSIVAGTSIIVDNTDPQNPIIGNDFGYGKVEQPTGFDSRFGDILVVRPVTGRTLILSHNAETFRKVNNNEVVKYVDDINGSDSNNGNSENTAYQTLEPVRTSGATKVFCKSGNYGALTNDIFNRDIEFISVGGKSNFVHGLITSIRTWTDEGGGLWSNVLGAQIDTIYDTQRTVPNKGFAKLILAESLVDCQNTVNSYFKDGSNKLYIHTGDGLTADRSTYLMSIGLVNGSASRVNYIENIRILNGFSLNNATSSINTFIAKGCEFGYTDVFNGVSLKGNITAYFEDCLVRDTIEDGFDTKSLGGFDCHHMELYTYADNCGVNSLTGIDNCSTIHDNCRAVRVGSVYNSSGGPVMHDVNTSKSWNIDVIAFNPLSAIPENNNSFACGTDSQETCEMWMDGCSDGGDGAEVRGGTMYVRNNKIIKVEDGTNLIPY